MAEEELQQRMEMLESQVKNLESRVRKTELDSAYVHIRSNWNLIQWYLRREQDRTGEGSDVYARAINAEDLVGHHLASHLREVHFSSQPMEAAIKWQIESTVILNRNGFTFLD